MKKQFPEKAGKIKKAAGFSAALSLALGLIFEILRQALPSVTDTPTATEYSMSLWRNFFLLILAVSLSALIFMFYLKRFGLLNSIFGILLTDSFLAFCFGLIMFLVSISKRITAIGISNIEAIYYYFLSIMIMLTSSIVFIATGAVFLTILLLLYIKNRKNRYNQG